MDETTQCFFPRKDHHCIDSDLSTILNVECRDGVTLRCFRFSTPAESTNHMSGLTLVYFHGNGELASQVCIPSEVDGLPNIRDAFNEMFRNHNLKEVICVEYRGYGLNFEVGPPTISNMLSDAEDVLLSLGVPIDALGGSLPQERVLVMGRSIGTLPAVHLASCFPRIHGLVVESGMSEPAKYISEKCSLPFDAFALSKVGVCLSKHCHTLRNFEGRLLLLHCSDDKVFPGSDAIRNASFACNIEYQDVCPLSPENSRLEEDGSFQVFESCRKDKGGSTSLVLFDDGGHNYIWPMNWKVYTSSLMEILQPNSAGRNSEALSLGWQCEGTWWSARSSTPVAAKHRGLRVQCLIL